MLDELLPLNLQLLSWLLQVLFSDQDHRYLALLFLIGFQLLYQLLRQSTELLALLCIELLSFIQLLSYLQSLLCTLLLLFTLNHIWILQQHDFLVLSSQDFADNRVAPEVSGVGRELVALSIRSLQLLFIELDPIVAVLHKVQNSQPEFGGKLVLALVDQELPFVMLHCLSF